MSSEIDSFDAFVEGRSRLLLRTAWMLTGDLDLAQDLLQSALARTYPHWRRVSREGDPTAYVRRVMVNIYRNWWGRWRRFEIPAEQVPDAAARDDAYALLDERERVRRALAQLPARQRVVLVLRFLEDLTEEQTADAMGCSVGTVKSQTYKARIALGHLLGEATVAVAGGEC